MGDDVLELEEKGWAALSAGGAEAVRFYDRVLDESVVMLLPGGMVLRDRQQILEAMAGPPWRSFALEDAQVLRPTPDTAVVHYGARAARDGVAEYTALMSSLYVRRGDGWKLAFHQQTPR
ncbi:MAG TPA: nuclear transport factor 2 family protein [Geodermatophilus sp.]|nr:nuclear transport factor 2 family protein [Geodermatophilus sp.]